MDCTRWLLVAAAGLMLVPGVVAEGVERVLPSTARCGESFVVTLHVDVPPDAGVIAVDEGFPTGWSVEGLSHGGSANTGRARWWNLVAEDAEYNYTLQAPQSFEGAAVFEGIYQWETMPAPAVISGATSVAVTCDAPDGVQSDGRGGSAPSAGTLPLIVLLVATVAFRMTRGIRR